MTNHSRSAARRGFTLIEVLVGMVIFAIVGALFTQLLSSQGRFFDKQGMSNAARNVSRGALNRVVSDFRMIETTGGVIDASPTRVTLRIPFAIGVVCSSNNTSTAVSMLPVDSVTYHAEGFYGYAWRNAVTGAYTYVENPAAHDKTTGQNACNNVLITTLPEGRAARITPLIAGSSLGTPVFLYRRVRYEFRASTAVVGKIGLFRTIIFPNGAQQSEELVAPFASTARFRFFVVGSNDVAQDAPPANLASIRGLELHLDGASEVIAAGESSVATASFTTAVFFKNRTN
ncbi:MAG: type II secretion system GspH family protein [Gemmatimonadota bacterium]|nr:type II secretion system GspH family protein [Gemmatimonadota bacterium]